MSRRFHSSEPCRWIKPKGKDARHKTHGRIEPMEDERKGCGLELFLISSILLAAYIGAAMVFL